VQIVGWELRAKTLRKRTSADAVTPQAASESACVRACSACSGRYEDPERTATSDSDEEEDAADAGAEDVTRSMPRDEFPAV
jgi:hypothetical protein